MADPQNQAARAEMSAAFARAVDLSALQRPPTNRAPGAATSASGARGAAGDGAGRSPGPGPDSPHIIEATDQNFEQVLQLSASVPVVVDLWASWCEPCKQLTPVLERLAVADGGTWILATVDIDANPGVAQAFQIQSVPTVAAVAAGRPVAQFSGAQPEPQVRQWLTQLVDQLRESLPGIKEAEAATAAEPTEPEPEDPRLVAALEATDRGDHDDAARHYQEILDAEPGHAEATSGLAWSQLLSRAGEAPEDVTQRSDADPTDIDAAIAVADRDVAGGAVADGFARLVRTIARTADEDRMRARDHLLTLFDLFAPDDPEVMAARRALTAALF